MVKKRIQRLDYTVMPLEGLWWADDMSAFVANDRSKWKWTMMIMQPPFVEHELIEEAIAETRKKKNLPSISKLRLEDFPKVVAHKCCSSVHSQKRDRRSSVFMSSLMLEPI